MIGDFPSIALLKESVTLENVKLFGSLSNYSHWHEMPKVTFHKQMVSVCSCPANFATGQKSIFSSNYGAQIISLNEKAQIIF